MAGYINKILEIDLTTKKTDIITIPDKDKERFIGGSGLSAHLFLERELYKVEPLSEENELIIMTGPLTGTTLPGTGRFTVCAKSPLTNIWGEGNCGGNFGPELKFAGYDGIIVKGISEKPAYLYIEDGKAEILNADGFWGRDTYDVTDILKDRYSSKAKVIAIGQAGENLVRYACIVNDKGDVIGRCGLGAVMGHKKLKAIVAKGTGKVSPALADEYNSLRKILLEKIKENVVSQSFHQMGTAVGMDMGMLSGDIPIKNWRLGDHPELTRNITGPIMRERYLKRAGACFGCPIACKRVVEVKDGQYKTDEGPGPEYESLCSLGAMTMTFNLPALIKANEMCNRYGLDTVSCGSTIAFVMECYENGIIKKDDADGIEPLWGDGDIILELIKKISFREGIGDILAEGSKRAAEKIGKGAKDYTVTVKGLEAEMHDPRGWHGMGLAYGTSNRGACHSQSMNVHIEQGVTIYPELGLDKDFKGQESIGKAEMSVKSQNMAMVVNSAVICLFVMSCISMDDVADMLRTTTSFDYNKDKALETGERIWLLKRGINNLMGVSSADDALPKAIMTPLKNGAAAGSVPDMKLMLKEFYQLMGIDEKGRPTKERLERFGLVELAARLYPV